jgi:hypothetical protein
MLRWTPDGYNPRIDRGQRIFLWDRELRYLPRESWEGGEAVRDSMSSRVQEGRIEGSGNYFLYMLVKSAQNGVRRA